MYRFIVPIALALVASAAHSATDIEAVIDAYDEATDEIIEDCAAEHGVIVPKGDFLADTVPFIGGVISRAAKGAKAEKTIRDKVGNFQDCIVAGKEAYRAEVERESELRRKRTDATCAVNQCTSREWLAHCSLNQPPGTPPIVCPNF